MNRITFRRGRLVTRGVIDLFVDDRLLRDLVRDVELPHATAEGRPDIAGKYDSLPEQLLETDLLVGQAIGIWAVLETGQVSGRVPLLVCECGEPGCWPLMATVEVRDDVITWRDFRQPYGKTWHYEALGPFRFDRPHYLAALDHARSAVG